MIGLDLVAFVVVYGAVMYRVGWNARGKQEREAQAERESMRAAAGRQG